MTATQKGKQLAALRANPAQSQSAVDSGLVAHGGWTLLIGYYFLRKVVHHRVVWAPTTGYQFVCDHTQSQVVESAAASGCTIENPTPQSPSTTPLPSRLGALIATTIRQLYESSV